MIKRIIKELNLKKLNQLMTLADKIVIVSILIISLSMVVITPRVIGSAGDLKEVVVTVDNQEVFRHPLEDNEELKRHKFYFDVEGNSYEGVLRMKDGRVRMERLSKEISPLSIHVDMGWISEPYQTIVSLPVRLIVTVETRDNDTSDSDIDIMAF
ncbi:NusG domain II-containing protein [Halonatronum saccharophilum]|uniref:NusG domain II-containing protein n=1 Tax=Halonatronum saccharophilum TaxID=150060 RepID=UPI0004AF2F84|nr:NusG domain II-containing protein [Halonatronum saccharophilum]